jgi:hypothetical protein
MAIFRCVGYIYIYIYIYNGLCRLCLRVALLHVDFSLSFTTCFGLHGHLQVRRIYIYTHNGLCRLCVRLRAALLHVGFSLSFTTCFGLHGHLQVRRIYIYTMGFAGYVSVCVQLYCMLVFHCLSLHVSAYVAIFMCVWFFNIYIQIFKDSASLVFLVRCPFLRGHTLYVFHLCFVPVLFSFVLFGVFLLMHFSACSLLLLFLC